MDYNTINNDVTVNGNAKPLLAGRFRIVKQLGAGGMGSVWLAEDTFLDNKLFAIKMLPSILFANKRAYRQLKDEAIVAMKLTHPNIVTLRAFEENNGNPFLVMDYIEGETLDDYLAEKGKLDETQIVRILKPIAAALDYAHSKGVVHRDVKPANVMIAKDGTPYILDFGIAREIQETMTRVTGKLSSGTLLYMSPEQLNGDSPKPPQDVYSFAAMAYECLKGEPPFSRGQIEFQILNRQPEPLSEGLAIASAIMAGLAKKPEERPQSCAAVLEGDSSRGGVKAQRVVANVNGCVEGHTPPPLRGTSPVSGEESGGSDSPSKIEGEAAERRGSMSPTLSFSPETGDVAAGRRGMTSKVFTAIIFAVLAFGGYFCWMKYDEGVKAREAARMAEGARMAAEAEAKRKAEEESERQKALAEEVRQKEEAERIAKASATEIRVEAKVLQGKVSRILDDDGFKAKKNSVEEIFVRSDAFFDEKVKRWNDAAQGFSNYVAQCKALLKLDGERRTAVSARVKANESRRSAELADAERYASLRWNEAVRLFDNAADEFVLGQFANANSSFLSIARQFDRCTEEANAERSRLAAEAREKAERKAAERRRQEAAAAKAQAEKVARERREVEESAKKLYGNRPKHGDTKTLTLPGGATMEMIYVAPGSFTMGSPGSEDGRTVAEKQHHVTLTKGFWLGKYEVTQKQWESVMGNNPSYVKGDDLPVENVSWDDCQEFISKVNDTLNCGARLPTEAEWEYACRAGTRTAYSWGDSLNGDKANCNGNYPYGTTTKGRYVEKTTEVGSYSPNLWGFYDMHGNVGEWCKDWFGEYSSGDVTDPQGAASGGNRILRGGGWRNGARFCRSAVRFSGTPGNRYRLYGFRLCCSGGQDGILAVGETLAEQESGSGVNEEAKSKWTLPNRIMLKGDGTSTDISRATKSVVNERPGVNYVPYINTPTGKMYVDAEVECPGTIIGNMGKDANGRWVFSVSATDGGINSLQGRVVRFQYNGKKGKKFVSASDVGKQIDVVLE